MDELIKNAKQEDRGVVNTPANNPIMNDGVKITNEPSQCVGSNTINITSNKYGADYNIEITLDFTAEEGKEGVALDEKPVYDMI